MIIIMIDYVSTLHTVRSQEEATNAWLATLNDNAFGSSAAPQTTWAAAPQPARLLGAKMLLKCDSPIEHTERMHY